MAQLYKSARVVKVPIAAVVDPEDILHEPSVGHQIGDPWVHIGAGAEVNVADWPADRTVISKARGKPPEQKAGLGKAVLDTMIGRGALVPAAKELPPDPAVQRTHPEADIFDDEGRARTVEVKKDEGETTPSPKKAKKGRK